MKSISLLKKVGLTLSLTLLPFTSIYAAPQTLQTTPHAQTLAGSTQTEHADIEYEQYSSTGMDRDRSVQITSNKVTGVTCDGQALREHTDYEVVSDYIYSTQTSIYYLHVPVMYLDSLPLGRFTLTVTYENGENQDFSVQITPAITTPEVTPLTQTYDLANPTPWFGPCVVFHHSNFLGIKRTNGERLSNDDYNVGRTMTDESIAFTPAFLNTLPLGETQFLFEFDNAEPIVYTLTIVDSSQTQPADIEYEQYSSTGMDTYRTTKITSNKVVDVTYDGQALKKGKDYNISSYFISSSGNPTYCLRVYNEYLDTLPIGRSTLTVVYEDGENQAISVEITPAITTPEVTPLTQTFDRAKSDHDFGPWVEFHHHRFLGIRRTNGELLYCDNDYHIGRTVTGECILFRRSFLKTLPLGDTQLLFEFDNSEPIVYTLTILNSTPSALSLKREDTSNGNATTLQSKFTLSTKENTTYDLNKLKIRYYYTCDTPSKEVFCLDNADMTYSSSPWYENILSAVNAQLVKMDVPTDTADTYLELSFDTDKVIDDSNTVTVSSRINHTDWTIYNEENDYSASDVNHICVYYDDVLINGVEPN